MIKMLYIIIYPLISVQIIVKIIHVIFIIQELVMQIEKCKKYLLEYVTCNY